ncbi:MxaK protein [Methylobacterium sp. ID0610]|uniref:MxaK protein n=1 Tax=Methylobacterium carpenticola TaxID=3344827 RepID=UPI0036CE9E25
MTALGLAAVRRPDPRRAWRRLRSPLFVLLPGLLAAAALGAAALSVRDRAANRTIAALEAGEDAAVSPGALPELLAARIRFLARRERFEEAEPLADALDRRGSDRLRGDAQRVLGDARLRQAFGRLEAGDLEKAGPLVVLAREAYRRALTLRPGDWDAKYNLDVASRLVRDFPERGRSEGEEMPADPKTIWTDIPGQLRGLP